MGAVYLLADVGGTNSRLAFGDAAGVRGETVRRYRNDDFVTFSDVVTQFIADSGSVRDLMTGCIALAGPVNGGEGRLTNRNWHISARAVAAQVGVSKIHLINDLSALAYSLKALKSPQVSDLFPAQSVMPNGQSVVLGLGTGVNAAVFVGNTVLSAEVGHSALTAPMLPYVMNPAPDLAVEQVMAGSGLERQYFERHDTRLAAPDVSKAFQAGDRDAIVSVTAYAHVLAHLLRQLTLYYLPCDGIYVAGSVARGLFDCDAGRALLADAMKQAPLPDMVSEIPVSLITDDAAALHGCLENARPAA